LPPRKRLLATSRVAASYTHTAHGPAAIHDGFQAALMVAAGIAAVGVLITATVLPGRGPALRRGTAAVAETA
jgi:hypothetical protein